MWRWRCRAVRLVHASPMHFRSSPPLTKLSLSLSSIYSLKSLSPSLILSTSPPFDHSLSTASHSLSHKWDKLKNQVLDNTNKQLHLTGTDCKKGIIIIAISFGIKHSVITFRLLRDMKPRLSYRKRSPSYARCNNCLASYATLSVFMYIPAYTVFTICL